MYAYITIFEIMNDPKFNFTFSFFNKNQFTGVYMYNWKILSQVKKKNLVVVCRVALCLVTSEESKRVKASSHLSCPSPWHTSHLLT